MKRLLICRMPWQGHPDTIIDRFDVRAHLDYIPPIAKRAEPEELNAEERQCNYESYRILAQNDFLGKIFDFAKAFAALGVSEI